MDIELQALSWERQTLPTANEFKVGDSFSYPYLYEGESENLAKPIVTEIITDVKELINWVRKTETLMDKKIKWRNSIMKQNKKVFIQTNMKRQWLI